MPLDVRFVLCRKGRNADRHHLVAEWHDKNKRVAIYDLTYSALKVHQNTGRGEVKRNPCIEFADV